MNVVGRLVRRTSIVTTGVFEFAASCALPAFDYQGRKQQAKRRVSQLFESVQNTKQMGRELGTAVSFIETSEVTVNKGKSKHQ